MNPIRKAIALGLLLAGTGAWAQTTEGLIVTTPDGVQTFAFSDVRELTFADSGLTLVKTDDATVEFPSDWQIRFGEVEDSGIPFVGMSDPDAKVQIFNTEGVLLKEVNLSELPACSLPKGVYIINCNGKSLKIKR